MAEAQQNQETPFVVKPEPSLSVIGVLREAFRTTRRNGKLVLSILFLVFLSSFQLELVTKLALKPTIEVAASNSPTDTFEIRAFTHTGPSQHVRSSQQANPGSYGYFGQSRSSHHGSPSSYGYRSSQQANHGSYGYYGQSRSSQQAKSGSYGYNSQSRSSQRTNLDSYGYIDQSTSKGQVRGVRSSQQAIPGSYEYMSQFVPRAEASSYSYVDQSRTTTDLKVIRSLLGVELLILAVSCVILLCFLVAVISSTYEAHTGKVMNLKDVFLGLRESWKRPIHTSFSLTLISMGFLFLFALLVGLVQILADGSTALILYVILALSASITYLHMAVQWMLSLVVSVLESDASGLKAIARAGELTKGKRIQASVLMILFHLAFGAVHMISNSMPKKVDGWVNMVVTIPFTIGLICTLKLFMFAVYTIYYHDRKMNHKEEAAKGQLGLYFPVTASDEAL